MQTIHSHGFWLFIAFASFMSAHTSFFTFTTSEHRKIKKDGNSVVYFSLLAHTFVYYFAEVIYSRKHPGGQREQLRTGSK